jgi:hypothetical protein
MDQRALAIIASRIANSTAVKTVARIQELMQAEKNKPRWNRLDVCMEVPFLNKIFKIALCCMHRLLSSIKVFLAHNVS